MLGNKSQLIREMHRRKVLSALRLEPGMTRAGLASRLGVTRATAAQLVNDLLEEGLARETGMLSARGELGGRPGTAVALNASGGYALGIEIGVDRLCLALLDLEGRIAGQAWVTADDDPRVGSRDAEALCDLIARRADALELLTGGRGFSSVGVAVPGFVDRRGVVVSAPLMQWSNVPLREMLGKRFRAPVLIANDANFSAWGEAYFDGVTPFGAQTERNTAAETALLVAPVPGFPVRTRAAHNLLFVLLEVGVGGGLLSEGMILAGADGLGCEIGHLRLDRLHMPSGLAGKVEAHLGREGILSRACADLQRPLDWKSLVTLVRSRDPLARAVSIREAEFLASFLADLTYLFNPDRIVLGGSVSALFALHLSEISTILDRSLVPEFRRPELSVSVFGSACCVLGAAAAAHDMLLGLLAGHAKATVQLNHHLTMPWEPPR